MLSGGRIKYVATPRKSAENSDVARAGKFGRRFLAVAKATARANSPSSIVYNCSIMTSKRPAIAEAHRRRDGMKEPEDRPALMGRVPKP
jgi:hypothetical protein